MYKRLYRSKGNRMISGVCGGMAEYFNVDPTIIRIIAIVAAFSGFGVLAYIVGIIVIPENNGETYNTNSGDPDEVFEGTYGGGWDKENKPASQEYGRSGAVVGIILVAIGVFFLLREFGILHWIGSKVILAGIFIAIGTIVILRGRRG